MLLNEYQWSRNPRGMHNFSAASRMSIDALSQTGMGWAKLVTIGPDYLDNVQEMLRRNITPIVRVWRPRFGAGAPTNDLVGIWRAYYNIGVRWFEFYNEPNLDNEWQEGFLPDYRDMAGTIIPIMMNWLNFAEIIINMGGYPAFPALSESIGRHYDAPGWLNAMMLYLADNHFDRFRAIANNGLWVATHPYFYNHFYQEGAGPLDPRPAGAQNANEGGWRFEYPYDPITQMDKPGLTAYSGPPDQPNGDPIGLCGMGHAFMYKFLTMFGGGAIPVVGTEGGLTPVPMSAGDHHRLDTRFPGYTWHSHGEATVAMFNWIVDSAPPWFFGVTLWKEDEYFANPGGVLPAVPRLAQTPPRYKSVPALDPLGGIDPLAVQRGPGPIHGSPNYHFLILAPGFSPAWFFQRGRAYWERFKPTILPSVEYLANIPHEKSVGVTILTAPEMSTFLRAQIADRYPNVWIDMLPFTSADDVGAVLDERAIHGRRFG